MAQPPKRPEEEPRQAVLSELVSVVQFGVEVFGHHHSVGELTASESLHGFLTVGGRDVLHEDLQRETVKTRQPRGFYGQNSSVTWIKTTGFSPAKVKHGTQTHRGRSLTRPNLKDSTSAHVTTDIDNVFSQL